MAERWEIVAEKLEKFGTCPTEKQLRVASILGVELGQETPTPVAAVILKFNLANELRINLSNGSKIPDKLRELETQLGTQYSPAILLTGSSEEVSAWFASRYALLSAKGLRTLQPNSGDIVAVINAPAEQMIVSTIAENGLIYMRGRRSRAIWPNHLEVVARQNNTKDYESLVKKVKADERNARKDYSPDSPQLNHLAAYKLTEVVPAPEAIRQLEDLLESGEQHETPFQELIERHPQFLSFLVTGNWGTFVIPKQKLGAEHVPDFLVAGVNSLGLQWVAVELEAPRHQILTQKKALRSEVLHAINQVEDWREWLTKNVSYAQDTLHLYGLTNRVPGLVIIGRDTLRLERDAARSRVAEQQNIQTRSWDWLIRQTKQFSPIGLPFFPIAPITAEDDTEITF